jgi:hypothetical protein
MGNMVRRAKSILGTNNFTVLFDKGYHTGSEIRTAIELGTEPIVAIPAISGSSMAPDLAYNVSEFRYDPKNRTYTCPQGNTLSTNGSWYNKERGGLSRKSASSMRVQHFKTKACQDCPVLSSCTKNTRGRGRVIERTEHQDFIDANRRNVEQKEHLYKRRQAIICLSRLLRETQLRNNQKTVELPLHHHQKRKGQGLLGCWVHVCGL